MHSCHVPFQHEADTCSCSPSQAQILLRKADMRERAWQAQVKADQRNMAIVFVVTSVLSFCSLYAVAAFVDQANSNLKSWVAANEPT